MYLIGYFLCRKKTRIHFSLNLKSAWHRVQMESKSIASIEDIIYRCNIRMQRSNRLPYVFWGSKFSWKHKIICIKKYLVWTSVYYDRKLNKPNPNYLSDSEWKRARSMLCAEHVDKRLKMRKYSKQHDRCSFSSTTNWKLDDSGISVFPKLVVYAYVIRENNSLKRDSKNPRH